MLRYQPRAAAFGGRLKKQHQESCKKQQEEQRRQNQTNGNNNTNKREVLKETDILCNGGAVENAIRKDIAELQKTALPFPPSSCKTAQKFRTGATNAKNNNKKKEILVGTLFQHYKEKWKELSFGTIYYDYPIRCDRNEFIQMIFSVCLGLLDDAISSLQQQEPILPQAECGSTNNTLLEEAGFAIFTLYSLFHSNPLPSIPTTTSSSSSKSKSKEVEADILKMLPLHLKSQSDEGHLNPKSTLYRRAFASPIRISHVDYMNMLELQNRCLVCKSDCQRKIYASARRRGDDNVNTTKGNSTTFESCMCCLSEDVLQVLQRMLQQSPKLYFELTEYSGPCSVEGYAGSRFVYKHTPKKKHYTLFTSESLQTLGTDTFSSNNNNALSQQQQVHYSSSLQTLHDNYISKIERMEQVCHLSSVQQQHKLSQDATSKGNGLYNSSHKQKTQVSRQTLILRQMLHPVLNNQHLHQSTLNILKDIIQSRDGQLQHMSNTLPQASHQTHNNTSALPAPSLEEQQLPPEQGIRVWAVGSTASALKAKFGAGLDDALHASKTKDNDDSIIKHVATDEVLPDENDNNKIKFQIALPNNTRPWLLSTIIQTELQNLDVEFLHYNIVNTTTQTTINNEHQSYLDSANDYQSFLKADDASINDNEDDIDGDDNESVASTSVAAMHDILASVSSKRSNKRRTKHFQSKRVKKKDKANINDYISDASSDDSSDSSYISQEDEKSVATAISISSIGKGQSSLALLLSTIQQQSTENSQNHSITYDPNEDSTPFNDTSSYFTSTVCSDYGKAALESLLNQVASPPHHSKMTLRNTSKTTSRSTARKSNLTPNNPTITSQHSNSINSPIDENNEDQSFKTAASSVQVGRVALDKLLGNIIHDSKRNKSKKIEKAKSERISAVSRAVLPIISNAKNDDHYDDDVSFKSTASSVAPGKVALDRLLESFHDSKKTNSTQNVTNSKRKSAVLDNINRNKYDEEDKDESFKASPSSIYVGKAVLANVLLKSNNTITANSKQKTSTSKLNTPYNDNDGSKDDGKSFNTTASSIDIGKAALDVLLGNISTNSFPSRRQLRSSSVSRNTNKKSKQTKSFREESNKKDVIIPSSNNDHLSFSLQNDHGDERTLSGNTLVSAASSIAQGKTALSTLLDKIHVEETTPSPHRKLRSSTTSASSNITNNRKENDDNLSSYSLKNDDYDEISISGNTVASIASSIAPGKVALEMLLRNIHNESER